MIIVGNIGACFCFEEETERLFFHFLGSFFFFFFAFFFFSFFLTHIYIYYRPTTDKGSGLGIFGMGATTLNLIHYQTAPLGMMTLDPAHLKHWPGLDADATIDVHSEWTVSV